MISKFFIDCGFGILDGFLSVMPDMSWTVDTSAWEYMKDFLDMICFLLPMDTIAAIAALILEIALVRVFIAFIRTLWGFIPFV